MNPPHTGRCLCGAVGLEADAFMPGAAHCHCSMCRRFHGAAFATIVSVRAEDFRWVRGEEMLRSFTADNGTVRTFCSQCGSSLLFYSPRAPSEVMEVALGVFDEPVPARPDAHIFVDSGAQWAPAGDGLPRFAAGRSSPRR